MHPSPPLFSFRSVALGLSQDCHCHGDPGSFLSYCPIFLHSTASGCFGAADFPFVHRCPGECCDTVILSGHSENVPKLLLMHLYMQGSYGSWKTLKVLEFYFVIFQDWEILEKAAGPGKF